MSAVAARPVLAACHRVTIVHRRGHEHVTALAEAEFVVHEGERVALYGASGSGKTTMLHVLGGLIVPSAGEVMWRGEPLSTVDAASRARARSRGIAYVFQGGNLLPTFTAYENVAFAARSTAAIRASFATADQVHDAGPNPAELLTLVGLAAKLDALPAELSGGEAQRVAIARALAQRPTLLLCDEPTGHLDSDTGTRVLDLIDALQAEYGFAQVTATHDADVAARYDRAVGLADGRIESDAE
jgi:predicted ABC-type transport system involved in lysophospholipase L1 biosynthesis ATPase subunit